MAKTTPGEPTIREVNEAAMALHSELCSGVACVVGVSISSPRKALLDCSMAPAYSFCTVPYCDVLAEIYKAREEIANHG